MLMKTVAQFFGGGRGRTRTFEGVSQRIYRLGPYLGSLPEIAGCIMVNGAI